MNGEKICELKCKYNISGKCNCYGVCIAKDLFIEELKHFKNKIKNELILNESMFEDLDDLGSLLTIIDKIYNKQIAKLEGSNG